MAGDEGGGRCSGDIDGEGSEGLPPAAFTAGELSKMCSTTSLRALAAASVTSLGFSILSHSCFIELSCSSALLLMSSSFAFRNRLSASAKLMIRGCGGGDGCCSVPLPSSPLPAISSTCRPVTLRAASSPLIPLAGPPLSSSKKVISTPSSFSTLAVSTLLCLARLSTFSCSSRTCWSSLLVLSLYLLMVLCASASLSLRWSPSFLSSTRSALTG